MLANAESNLLRVKATVEKEIKLKSSQGSSSHSDNHANMLEMELGIQLPFLFLAFLFPLLGFPSYLIIRV